MGAWFAPRGARVADLGVTGGRWDGLPADVERHSGDMHDIFTVRIPQASFLDRVPVGPHPASGCDADLARAFGAVCLRLRAEAGLFLTHPDQANLDFVLSREWRVLARDADGLADERFGLLYMDDTLASAWTHTPTRDDRDEFPVATGRLVFAGRGPNRWF
jgi:hypothetical protein